MKLKTLLEGYAWERNADGSLPTLADATQKHEWYIILKGYQFVLFSFKFNDSFLKGC